MPQRLTPVPTEPIPAIGYIRVSMAREEMISPEIQRSAIEDWARRNGREILTPWVEDLDKSGRNFKRKITKAIDRVRAGEAKEIIVWKFSRFGRNRLGWAIHLDQVESVGGDLVSATEEVDARTAAGRFTRGMLAEVAAFESDRFGEQWQEAHAHRRQNGLPATGTPRFGYIRKGRMPVPGKRSYFIRDPNDDQGERYEPHPEYAPVLISVYERYATGEGSNSLVRWLNSRGILTTRGGPWTVHTLFAVLDSGFAAGLLRTHDPDCQCTQRGRCNRVVYIPGAHPAIIGPGTDHPDLWDQYQKRRAAMRKLPPRARKPVYPLSGLMRCGACGHGMSISNGNGAPGYAYRCTIWQQRKECDGAWTRRAHAEAEVLRQLRAELEEIERAAAAMTPAAVTAPPVRSDRARLEAEAARVERALARLVRLRALDDDESPEADAEFAAARDELRAERARIAEQLDELAAEEDQPRPADHAPVIRALLEQWEELPVQRRRDMLASVVRCVKVYRTEKGQPARVKVVPVWEKEPA